MGLFDWFGGGGDKVQTVPYEGIKSLKQIEETEPYTKELWKRIYGAPEEWSQKFYEQAYEPTAARVRGEWGEQVQAPLMQQAGAMGAERATPTINRLARELTRRELGLAEMAGTLRTQGLEAGRQVSGAAMSGMQNYINTEADVNQRWAAGQLGAAQQTQLLRGQRQQQESQVIPNVIGAAGSLMTMGSTPGLYGASPTIWEQLGRRVMGGNSQPYGGGGVQSGDYSPYKPY